MENMMGIGIGISDELAIAALFLWIVGFLIAKRYLGVPAALILSTIKMLIPLLYFSHFFNPGWLMRDDRVYQENSVTLFNMGYGPINLIFDPMGWKDLRDVVGSDHILYYWWILLSFYMFGKFYYAPVFLNVCLTYVAAGALYKLAGLCGFSKQYRTLLAGFFLLHWDILTWSSLFNLKDMIVLTLTVSAMLGVSLLTIKLRPRYFAFLAVIFFLFGMIRYYVPVLIVMGSGLWFLSQWDDKRKYLLVPVGVVLLLVMLSGGDQNLHYVKIGSPFTILRFFMMPQFWSVEGGESFLYLSSLLHWILFAPLLFGAYQLWYKSSLMRLPLIYAAIIIYFYSIVPELQGYRHRLQISWVIAWCQFHAVWLIFQLDKARGPGSGAYSAKPLVSISPISGSSSR